MFRMNTALPAVVLLLGITPAAAAIVPVDLSGWVSNGGSWAIGTGNDNVSQSANSPTIAFHSNDNQVDRRISGKVKVETTTDDDFLGFVLGYKNNDIRQTGAANTGIDYILVDWKQAAQGSWGAGMAVSRVTGNIWEVGNNGTISLASDGWTHTGDVEFGTRSNAPGAAYGTKGWADNREYDFAVDYTSQRIRVEIDGQAELDISPSLFGLTEFNEGAFGFYGFSQPNVRFAALTSQPSPLLAQVPLPAGLPLMVASLGAAGLTLRRRKSRSA